MPWNPSFNWVKELKWSDFFGGVKKDIVKAAKTIQTSTTAVLGGVTSALTPTVIWIVVVVIIGLLLYTWVRKAVKI